MFWKAPPLVRRLFESDAFKSVIAEVCRLFGGYPGRGRGGLNVWGVIGDVAITSLRGPWGVEVWRPREGTDRNERE
jgi:hypothetical protein